MEMMQKRSNTFLKRSSGSAKSVTPGLTPATSHLLGGPYSAACLQDFQAVTIATHPFNKAFNQRSDHDVFDNHGFRQQPGKKRRLSSNQVKFLESSFDVNSKLEPARKNQLADELGLQPRQVAVWFQNRRARSKTKHLERKYNVLKVQHEATLAQKQQLAAEVAKLRELLGLQQDKTMVLTVAAKASGQNLEKAGAIKQQEPQSGVTCDTRAWKNKEALPKKPKEEMEDPEEEAEGEIEDEEPDEAADHQDEETAAETEGESQEFSCATGQSEALDANSPASNYEQLNTGALSEIHPQQMNSSMDHRLFCNNQQHMQLHQFHPHNWFNELASVIKPAAVADVDHLYNNHLLSFEDETASLYYEFATQC